MNSKKELKDRWMIMEKIIASDKKINKKKLCCEKLCNI